MQRSDIRWMIENRSAHSASSKAELADLANQYPYCSTLRILHAISAKEEDSIDQKQILNIASVYAKDRSKLYGYIVKRPLEKTLERSADEFAKEPTPKAGTDQSSAIQTEKLEGKEIASEKSEVDGSEQDQSQGISHRPLEEEIMREAMTHIGELETGYALENLDDSSNEAETKNTEDSQPASFGAWLKRFDSEKENKKSQTSDLIDRFIEESPQISPVKTAFFSPAQMGKMSLVDDESFVTETLANIYSKQGDFKKAAQAYKNLGLKYPEKRIYFAALQKEAEKNLKK